MRSNLVIIVGVFSTACTATMSIPYQGSAVIITDPVATTPVGWTHEVVGPTTESASGPDAVDGSEILFNEDEIQEFHLGVSPDAWQSLLEDPRTWVEATLTWSNLTFSPVGLRCKGENSFLPINEKCSLKIKLDRFEPSLELLGLKELTLNNMSEDRSMMHDRVAYKMYRAAGVPAARANHAWVTINGADYGLFSHIETVDRRMARRWFADDTGSMFEIHDVDFMPHYVDDFELEFGPDDRTRISGVSDALLDRGPAALQDAGEFMDWEQFLLYWAVGAVVAQTDAYPYSNPGDDCHVYDDPTTGLLHWLPHGADETFSDTWTNVGNPVGRVARRCADQDCYDRFVELVFEVQTLAETVDLAGYAAATADQIDSLSARDQRKPYSDADVTDEQREMVSFIERRRGALEDDLY